MNVNAYNAKPIVIDTFDYGAYCEIALAQNARAQQQDAFFVLQDGVSHFFGVVDGHGPEGRWVAQEVQEAFPQRLEHWLRHGERSTRVAGENDAE